ncbi:MAG: ATP-binding protein [Myxococcota bacterium]
MSQLDLAIVGIYMVATLFVGIYFGRKTDSFKDFAIGDRKIGTMMLVAAMFSTHVGGASTIGLSEKVFQVGFIFVFVMCGRAVWKLIESFFIFKKMDKCLEKSASAGDIMGYFYGKPGKLLFGAITTLIYIAAVGLQMRAIGYLFEYFLGLSLEQGTFLGAGLVVLYASFGGIRAVTATDALQFAVLIVAIPMLAYWGLKEVGGYEAIAGSVPEAHTYFFPRGPDAGKYISMFLLYSFPLMVPMSLQRLLMAKNASQGAFAWQMTAWISVPFFCMVGLVGLIAFTMKSDLEPGLAMLWLAQQATSPGAQGLIIVGILAVIMSTADSMLHTGMVALVHDVIVPLRKKQMESKAELRLAQFASFISGFLAIGVALKFSDILTIDTFLLSFWSVTIPIPLIAAVFGFRASAKTLIGATCINVIAVTWWNIWGVEITGISSFVPGILCSFCSFFGLRMLDPPHVRHPAANKNAKGEVKVESTQAPTMLGTVAAARRSMNYLVFGIAMLTMHIIPSFFPGTWQQMPGSLDAVLRLGIGLCCCVFLFHQDLPGICKHWLPKLWRFTLGLGLPFGSTLMLLSTHYSAMWQSYSLVGLVLLLLIAPGKKIRLYTQGMGAALLTHSLFNGLGSTWTVLQAVPLHVVLSHAVLLFGVRQLLHVRLSNYRQTISLLRKACAGGFHEPVTRVGGLGMRCETIAEMFPILADAYEKAKAAGIKVGKIQPFHLETMKQQVPKLVKHLAAAVVLMRTLVGNMRGEPAQLNMQPHSMAESVKEVLDEYPFQWDEREKVHLEIEQDFVAKMDLPTFKQIFFNMAGNAVHFMRELSRGQIFIRVTKSEDGKWGVMRFKDTAKGITSTDMPYVLDEFFSKRKGGSGLGLSYCAKTMHAMGGSLTVSSQEGAHTTVTLKFPIEQ